MADFRQVERFAEGIGIKLTRQAFRRLTLLAVVLGLVPNNRILKWLLERSRRANRP